MPQTPLGELDLRGPTSKGKGEVQGREGARVGKAKKGGKGGGSEGKEGKREGGGKRGGEEREREGDIRHTNLSLLLSPLGTASLVHTDIQKPTTLLPRHDS